MSHRSPRRYIGRLLICRQAGAGYRLRKGLFRDSSLEHVFGQGAARKVICPSYVRVFEGLRTNGKPDPCTAW